MSGSRLKELRQHLGLTQADLAQRAKVSRQLVGAVEAGRHLPRVDAAVALATALGVGVEQLFGPVAGPVGALTGLADGPGAVVRLGRVGDLLVTAPARVETEGWDQADAVVDPRGQVTPFGRALREGIVVGGCEPSMVLLERMLRSRGIGAVAVAGSTQSALKALAEGRLHAAVVHGPEGRLPPVPNGVTRLHLTRWMVGLAGPADHDRWVPAAIAGRLPTIQREDGAGAQLTFEEAVGPERLPIPGPRVSSHLEAARRAAISGMPAVTIEPAALAVGAGFHPLAEHAAQVWIGARWDTSAVIESAMAVIVDPGFHRRLEGVGGYDLTGIGRPAA